LRVTAVIGDSEFVELGLGSIFGVVAAGAVFLGIQEVAVELLYNVCFCHAWLSTW